MFLHELLMFLCIYLVLPLTEVHFPNDGKGLCIYIRSSDDPGDHINFSCVNDPLEMACSLQDRLLGFHTCPLIVNITRLSISVTN